MTISKAAVMLIALFMMSLRDDPQVKPKKIPVLSVGTFHMTCTTDKHTTPFDAKDPKRIKETNLLVEKLARFKPTIIAVEYPFADQATLDKEFQSFSRNDRVAQECDGERVLIGFELAKRLKIEKVHGIDVQLNYDYEKIIAQAKESGNEAYKDLESSQLTVFKMTDKKFVDDHTVVELMRLINRSDVLNELYLLNAGIFSYVNTPEGYEGADAAADFYKRNLRMFANLNKIKKSGEDRILVLCGAGHTVFFNDFIARSHLYELHDLASVLE